MKKYEFIKNGVDDYTLKYKDKEINFNSNVDIVTRLQDSIAKARKKMIMDLAKDGISIKDLVIEKKENGKTYYDNTNKEELERAYIEEVQGEEFNKIIEETLNIKLVDLYMQIGIRTENENEEFIKEFGEILTGNYNTPSN